MKKTRRKYVLKNIKKYQENSGASSIMLLLLGLSGIPLVMYQPILFQTLIDNVIYRGKTEELSTIIVGMVIVFVAMLLIDSIGLYSSNKIRNAFTLKLREDTWHKISALEFFEFEKYRIADLKMRISDDANCLGNFIKDQVADYILGMVLTIVSIATAFYINWRMTLICILIIPILFVINNKIGKISQRVNDKIRCANEKYYGFEHNTLQMWKEVKLQNMEKECINVFQKHREKLAKLGYEDIKCWLFREVFNDFRNNYFMIILYGIGAFFVIKGSMSVGMLFAFSRYISIFLTNINLINDRNAALKSNFPYYSRIFETLRFKEEYEGKICLGNKNIFELKNVSFSYGNNRVLKNYNMKLKSKDFLIMKEESGWGKSTIVKILLGLNKSSGGKVLINGMSLKNISKQSFYENISVVMQDTYLFNMSIRENICMAKPESTLDEIEKACKQVDILDFVHSLKDGFDTVIGEGGIRLSGGQRQKIALARIFLNSPKLIVLDEATSSLDRVSESLFIDNLKKSFKNSAVLMITH